MPLPTTIERPALRTGQVLCAAAVSQIEQPADKPARWRLNSGAEMQTWVEGIGHCRLVIDLASVKFEAPEIPMLREHSTWYGPIGRWTAGIADLTGIYATPIVYTPNDDAEREMPSLREGAEVAALMARKHPWQASVKVTASLGDYERVLPGAVVEVNGATLTAGDDLHDIPLLICRNGVIGEASVCLFGADSNTGSVAASRSTTTPEPTMSKPEDRIAALLKRHGEKHASRIAIALSKNKSDEEIAVELSDATDTDHKAALAAKDEEITKLKADLAAANTTATDLQAKLDALKGDDEETEEETPAATAGESKNGAPKSFNDGVAILKREGTKLVGFKLRSAVLKRFPALRKDIPAAV